MNRPLIPMIVVIALMGLTIAGQSQAAPAANAEFPEKGKPITIIVPQAAGGASDVNARLLAPHLEKELGTTVQIVNRPGAGMQVGTTEMVRAKPDGHTLSITVLPLTITLYLDPGRKAVFGRKDLQPVALLAWEPIAIGVKADSRFKALKEVVEAAKASPEKIRASAPGILGPHHLTILQLERITGSRFAIVQFDGGAPALNALLGGHVDVSFGVGSDMLRHVQGGTIRVLGVAGKQEYKFLPGVKTLEAQGYKVYNAASRGLIATGGTPKAAVGILARAIKKSLENEEFKKKIEAMGQELNYMDPDQMGAYWDELEGQVAPFIKEAIKK